MLQLPELQFGARLAATSNPLRYLWEDAPQAVAESLLGGNQPYAVILAPSPSVERLYVPSTPLDVFDASIGQHSTAGVVVEDLTKLGRVGVTAALHGISTSSTSVTVDGKSGTVIRTHPITDSAFIEVPNPSCVAMTTKGVMSGLVPRGSQNADFVGAVSKRRTTKIVGFAFERTLPGQSPVQCSWVWGESVMNGLQVKLI